MNVDDFPTTESTFYAMFGDVRTSKRPTGLDGVNFMTSDILGYVKVGGESVEISTGWFMDHRIIGVTYGPSGDERSCMVDTLAEARELLFGAEVTP
jgi:hypothetical protein